MLYTFLTVFSTIFAACDSYVTYDFNIKGDSLNGYYISTFIGTPPQHINMLIDTGSSNLAVACISQESGNARYFVYNESLSFHPSNVDVNLHYIEGGWSGILALDVFDPCVEGGCTVICNISCMTTINNIFDSTSEFQGILGLAYSSIAVPDSMTRPFFDVFSAEKKIRNIFSLLLCGPYFSSKTRTTSCGKFHVGYHSYDYIGEIMYTPILHEWYYEVTLTDFSINGKSISVTCEEFNKHKTIIDSGTTDLNVPPVLFKWLISEIRYNVNRSFVNEFWLNETVMCTYDKSMNMSIFPNLSLSFYHSNNSSFSLRISPELYMLPFSNFNANCAKLAIGVSDFGTVIGSSILKGFYVVFDRENKKIGFANPKVLSNITFISEVSGLQNNSANLDLCIRNETPADVSISPLMIIGLICISIIAILILYALLTWIWKFHIMHEDNASDTSSLVDDD